MIRALRSLHAISSEFYKTWGFDPWDNFRWREVSVINVLNDNGWNALTSPGRSGSDFTADAVTHGEIKTKLAGATPRFQWSRLNNPASMQTMMSTDCFVFAVFNRLDFQPQCVWCIRDPEAVSELKALVVSRIPPAGSPRDTVSVTLKEVLEFRHEELGTARF